MTVVNPKSISGINSITMASGSDNLLTIHSNNTTERVRVDSSGNLTATSFSGDGSSLTGVASTENIRTNTNATFLQNINVSGTVTATSYAGDGSNLTGIAATANVRTGILDVAGVSTFRNNVFQPSGRIVRGSTSTIQDGDAIAGGVNITGTDMDASVIMSVFGNDNDFNRISGAKSRNATVGSHTIIQDGDSLLQIKAFGSDGTDFEEAAYIDFRVDGVPGDNDMPGRIQFYTTADGASSGTERMSIDKNGDVNVKTGNVVVGTSGKGISFSATGDGDETMTSELLDDYEEGSWTPTVNVGTVGVAANGEYVKVGRWVQISVLMYNFSDTSSGTSILVGGVPYAAKSGAQFVGNVWIRRANTGDKNYNCVIGDSSSTLVNIKHDSNGNDMGGDLAFSNFAHSTPYMNLTISYQTA